MTRNRIFDAAIWTAWLGWFASVWALWRGGGVLRYFGQSEPAWDRPASLLVLGMVAIALWLILRRMRRGVLLGRATLWSSVSALVFVCIGGMLAVRYPDAWMLWTGPAVLGLALLVLALEPFVTGEA